MVCNNRHRYAHIFIFQSERIPFIFTFRCAYLDCVRGTNWSIGLTIGGYGRKHQQWPWIRFGTDSRVAKIIEKDHPPVKHKKRSHDASARLVLRGLGHGHTCELAGRPQCVGGQNLSAPSSDAASSTAEFQNRAWLCDGPLWLKGSTPFWLHKPLQSQQLPVVAWVKTMTHDPSVGSFWPSDWRIHLWTSGAPLLSLLTWCVENIWKYCTLVGIPLKMTTWVRETDVWRTIGFWGAPC